MPYFTEIILLEFPDGIVLLVTFQRKPSMILRPEHPTIPFLGYFPNFFAKSDEVLQGAVDRAPEAKGEIEDLVRSARAHCPNFGKAPVNAVDLMIEVAKINSLAKQLRVPGWTISIGGRFFLNVNGVFKPIPPNPIIRWKAGRDEFVAGGKTYYCHEFSEWGVAPFHCKTVLLQRSGEEYAVAHASRIGLFKPNFNQTRDPFRSSDFLDTVRDRWQCCVFQDDVDNQELERLADWIVSRFEDWSGKTIGLTVLNILIGDGCFDVSTTAIPNVEWPFMARDESQEELATFAQHIKTQEKAKLHDYVAKLLNGMDASLRTEEYEKLVQDIDLSESRVSFDSQSFTFSVPKNIDNAILRLINQERWSVSDV